MKTPTLPHALGFGLVALACAHLLVSDPAWPSARSHAALLPAEVIALPRMKTAIAAPARSNELTADDERIREQPVCVASSVWSAGTLGDVVLYRYQREGDRLRVGYFVYWSSERPWGDNSLTYTLFPALAVDVVYSHFLFVLPGLQRALYGAGDVEGALVEYRVQETRLVPERGLADDEHHRSVRLSRADLLGRGGRVMLLTEAWSHQLGAAHAASRVSPEASNVRCFDHETLRPLSDDVARDFQLGSARAPHRARPAWAPRVD